MINYLKGIGIFLAVCAIAIIIAIIASFPLMGLIYFIGWITSLGPEGGIIILFILLILFMGFVFKDE